VLSYDIVDVFTDRPFAGNPLAVVQGAQDLSTSQLQSLASEFNLSETAFPTTTTALDRAADGLSYQVRIFTPAAEIPFAGHPSIGTAWVLRRDELIRVGSVTQHCQAGRVKLAVPADPAGPIELEASPSGVSQPIASAPVLRAVGLSDEDGQGLVRVSGCGLDFVFLRVDRSALERAVPAVSPLAKIASLPGRDPIGGVSVYAVNAADQLPLRIRARVFCPDVGVLEDPATGAAALGLGPVLVADGALPNSGGSYIIDQGVEMGRPSVLRCRVEAAGAVATRCFVAGHVTPLAAGRIRVPPDV
jgi:trans-2,3-dihydro-3-hydroxyanthranilate isomerase